MVFPKDLRDFFTSIFEGFYELGGDSVILVIARYRKSPVDYHILGGYPLT